MTCTNSTLYFFTHPTCGITPSSIASHLYHKSAQVISSLAQSGFHLLASYGTQLSSIAWDKAKKTFTYSNMKDVLDFSVRKTVFAAKAIYQGSKNFTTYVSPIAERGLHVARENICKIHPLVKKAVCH
jgi:hypothetical protein